jgi:hypothetical protein
MPPKLARLIDKPKAIDPELLALITEIYQRWTGEEFAQALAHNRKLIQAAEQQALIKEQIASLQEKLE